MLKIHLKTNKCIFQDAEKWQIVFYIASGVYLFGAIFYGTFASGNLQPWAKKKTFSDEYPMEEPIGHDNKSFQPDY